MIAAGLGCRRHCPPADIIAVLRDAEARAGTMATALAAPAFKSAEQGLIEAARTLGLPLLFIEDDALAQAQPSCVTKSEAARQHTGHASIAEAAALAACGPNARLLLARITHPAATCAIAESSP